MPQRPADQFQKTRRLVQYAFLALNLWIAAQFLLWVRAFEHGTTPLVARPAGVDGWLPIAGLMNTKLFLTTGHIPAIHPAAMVLFLAFCAISLIAKKSFCSWLCPIGTLSEHLALLGRKLFGKNLRLPRALDIALRGLKYLLLAFFVVFIAAMSAEALTDFLSTPYGILADVKMLCFFRHLGPTALLVLAALAALALVVEQFWCRYLCPYGALMGLLSRVSPLKIRRHVALCTGCGKCARACPAALPVDKLLQIRSAECTACMRCVSSCPTEGALQFSLPLAKIGTPLPRYRRALTPTAFVVLIAALFCGFVLAARATDHWQTHIPNAVYQQLIPNAGQLAHPGLQ